jgi:DNA-binding beta-propeller fold protein YncE
VKSLYKNFIKWGGVIASLVSVLGICTPAQALSTYASGFNSPRGIAFDSSGNLFVSNNSQISKVGTDGTISTFVSGLNRPEGLAFNSDGNLFVADSGLNTVTSYNTSGSIVTTLRGISVINQPRGLAFASDGRLYISSPASGVSIIDLSNRTLDSTVVSTSSGAVPFGIAISPLGLRADFFGRSTFVDGIFFTDVGINSTIRRISNPQITTLFSNGDLSFGSPLGVAFDPVNKNLYISDADRNTITALNPETGVNSVLVSSGLNQPTSLAVLGDNLYISDTGSSSVLEFQLRTTPIPFEFNPALGLVAIGVFVVGRKLIKGK